MQLHCVDIVPVFPRIPSEWWWWWLGWGGCGKQKYCSGLDFPRTAAILLSTSSLQQTRLPLLQPVCDMGWWVRCFEMQLRPFAGAPVIGDKKFGVCTSWSFIAEHDMWWSYRSCYFFKHPPFFFSLLNFPPNLLLTAYICLFHTAWFSKYVSQANAEGVIFFPQRLGVKCDILSHTL